MYRISKRVLSFLVLALLAVIGSAAQAQSLKVGVFDPQRVSLETAEGKRVQIQRAALRDEKQAEITAKQKAITELQEQLSQQSLSLSPDRRNSLQMDIQRRMLELDNANELASRELQLEVSSAQARFNEKLLAGIEAFGRDEGLDLILDRSLVAWSGESIDVTTAIIDRFDQLFPAEAEE